MRVSPLVPVAMFVLMSGPAAAQGWVEYQVSRTALSSIFLASRSCARSYPTEFGITLSARVYTVADGPNRYTITAVDYSAGQQIHADRVKNCKVSRHVHTAG